MAVFDDYGLTMWEALQQSQRRTVPAPPPSGPAPIVMPISIAPGVLSIRAPIIGPPRPLVPLSQQAPAVAAAVLKPAAAKEPALLTEPVSYEYNKEEQALFEPPLVETDVSLSQPGLTAPVSDVPEVVSLAPEAAAAAILQTKAKKKTAPAPGRLKKMVPPVGGAVAGFLVAGPVGAGVGAALGWFLGRSKAAAAPAGEKKPPAAAAAAILLTEAKKGTVTGPPGPTMEEMKKQLLEAPTY